MSGEKKTSWHYGVSDFSTSEPFLNGETIIATGFDFIEPGLAKIVALSETDFLAGASRLKNAGINVKSANWFLPPTLKVVGPEARESDWQTFLETAFARAAHLGAQAIVFGSPGSRSIPTGWSELQAREQIIAFCHLAADLIHSHQYPLRIALEHVNHTETNFLNTFTETLALAREIDRTQIGLAADFYHFAMEGEATEIIREAPDLLCAVQLANPQGRVFPARHPEIPGLLTFFEQLAALGYQGGISVEATVGPDLAADCREAAAFFQTLPF